LTHAPAEILDFVAGCAAVLTGCGLATVAGGTIAVHLFGGRARRIPRHYPAVSVLKPLCGDEPQLEAALASICEQSYPAFQIIFGVQDANDPALLIVQRIRARFPDRRIDVVVDPALHGVNRKISNLINMMRAVQHGVLVFSDSDLHVQPDYLERIVAALQAPGCGLVTTLGFGLPTMSGLIARLGATEISHTFLPGALLSRMFGRQDCLGTTMALRVETLARIGGLNSLVRHVADDNVLGQRVQELGLRIALADTVVMTAVPEVALRALWQHELRWSRTVRALEPGLLATSVLQFPIFWATIAFALSGGCLWFLLLFFVAWAARAAAARSIDHVLLLQHHAAARAAVWMLPLRDLMSVGRVVASYFGTRVVWRGHVMRAVRIDKETAAAPVSARIRPVGAGDDACGASTVRSADSAAGGKFRSA
jgi:ceramide glucosyltransferase